MLFTSAGYGIFILVVFIAYYVLFPAKWKWLALLIASIVFYYSWNSFFIVIISLSIIIDYVVGWFLNSEGHISKRKVLLAISVVSNIGLLATFKYYNFFADNINYLIDLTGLSFQFAKLSTPFPIGISFYTFQTLSYTIDIYKGYRKREPHFGKFALYVLFFPQLLAGPIERSRKLLPQINQLRDFDYSNVVGGMRLILWGLFKKIVVADLIGVYVTSAYNAPHEYSGIPLLMASCLFTIQIYCDFSGYTDMAIGSARIFGINLSRNFENRVYLANSKTEFWKGWHITLTEWFRDYLFFAVVGKARSQITFYASLVFVFTITGLWHGADWGFIIWGALNGVWIMIERLTHGVRQKSLEKVGIPYLRSLFSLFAIIFTFISNTIFSPWFRSENFDDSIRILKYSFSFGADNLHYLLNQEGLIMLSSILLMDFFHLKMGDKDFDHFLSTVPKVFRWAAYVIIIEWILLFAHLGGVHFYYFRF